MQSARFLSVFLCFQKVKCCETLRFFDRKGHRIFTRSQSTVFYRKSCFLEAEFSFFVQRMRVFTVEISRTFSLTNFLSIFFAYRRFEYRSKTRSVAKHRVFFDRKGHRTFTKSQSTVFYRKTCFLETEFSFFD